MHVGVGGPTLAQEEACADTPVLWQLGQASLDFQMPDAGVDISVPLLYPALIYPIPVVHASHGEPSFSHCPGKVVFGMIY